MKIRYFCLFIIFFIPFSVFAFEEMTDASLDDVSGQSGIDIFLEGTTKAQLELGDFKIIDDDTDGGAIFVDSQEFGGAGDKVIFYMSMKDVLFTIDVGSSGSGIFDYNYDTDDSNQIVDNTQYVLENRSFVKIGLPPSSGIEIRLEMPGKNDIQFQNKNGSNALSLGGLVMTPMTVKINEIYNDLFIASH